MGSNSSSQEELYSASMVHEALDDILPPEFARSVLGRIAELQAEKLDNRQILKAQLYAANLAVFAHQNVVAPDDAPEMLDVIVWERMTNDTSIEVLRSYKKLSADKKDTIPTSVIDFAACYVAQREASELESSGLEGLLNSVGYTIGNIRSKFIDLLVETDDGSHTRSDLEKAYPTIDEFDCCLPVALNEVAVALEQPMRRDLISLGYDLPELGEDNTYGYDEAEGQFRMPEVTEGSLPK